MSSNVQTIDGDEADRAASLSSNGFSNTAQGEEDSQTQGEDLQSENTDVNVNSPTKREENSEELNGSTMANEPKDDLEKRLAYWQDIRAEKSNRDFPETAALQGESFSDSELADIEPSEQNISDEEPRNQDSKRYNTLLEKARNDRAKFLEPVENESVTGPAHVPRATPSRDPNDAKGAEDANQAMDSASFAFPVTKQIFTFLGRFGSREDTADASEAAPVQRKSRAASASDRQAQYTRLLEKLSDPSVAPIVKGIKSFVIQFNGSQPAQSAPADLSGDLWADHHMPGEGNPDGPLVRDFIQSLCRRVRVHPRWERVPPQQWEEDREGLEKLVTSRIYERAFAATPRDRAIDRYLLRRIQALSFIEPRHLDIRRACETDGLSWAAAGTELGRMSVFRSPRDKMVCVLNACRIITDLLTRSAEQEGKLPGADEFLPALIYVVIRANPKQLHSNIEFIASFREAKKLVLEPGYFFTNLTSAVAFIHRVDASMLSISEQEFERGIKTATAGDSRIASTGKPTGVTDMLLEENPQQQTIDDLRRNPKAFAEWKNIHGRFKSTPLVNLLHRDVPAVLSEYKYLYDMCEKLLQEKLAARPLP